MHIFFIILIGLNINKQGFSPFPIVKMNANYADICRAGKFETDFQQDPLVQFLSEIITIFCETSII